MTDILKKYGTSLCGLMAAGSLASCGGGYSNAQRDAGTGALLGGAAGAVIGNQSDSTAEGAAVGAGLGAAAGYAVGNEKDKRR